MSYRTVIAYERQGKVIHLFFLLCAVISGALATIIFSTLGILPDLKIFVPESFPRVNNLATLVAQGEFLPVYIHFLFLTSLSYALFRVLNFVYQRISLSGIKKELDGTLQFGSRMRDLKASIDEEEVARFLYNLKNQLSANGKYSLIRFTSFGRRRISAVFEAVSDLSSENILLINDTLASPDHIQTDYGYRFIRFLVRLAVLLGVIGSLGGLAVLAYSVIAGGSDIKVLSSHLAENLMIGGYAIVGGIILQTLCSFSRHLDESFLLMLDNFLVAEIVQKIPFKGSDSLVLLKTYLRTLRNLEKTVENQLDELNSRIDHLVKTLKKR